MIAETTVRPNLLARRHTIYIQEYNCITNSVKNLAGKSLRGVYGGGWRGGTHAEKAADGVTAASARFPTLLGTCLSRGGTFLKA